MIIGSILLIILSVIFLLYGYQKVAAAKSWYDKRVLYDNQYQKYKNEVQNLKDKISLLQNTKMGLNKDIEKRKNQIDSILTQGMRNVQNQITLFKKNSDYASKQYFSLLEKNYAKVEKQYDSKIKIIQSEIISAEKELNQFKKTITSAIQAKLREKEKQDNLSFYSLEISQKDNYQINVIKSIQSQLSNPRPLRMIIWTNYYSKKVNEMAARILGTNTVIGIYKITNIKTGLCYIGQSKDVKERWREHCKCGLGIDTPAGNKLYKAMMEDGLQSFTFQLLCKCDPAELNEKEKSFIDLYCAYDYGYNSSRGIGI